MPTIQCCGAFFFFLTILANKNVTRLENKTQREIMNMDRKTAQKTSPVVINIIKLNIMSTSKKKLQDSEPTKLYQQNHMNIQLFGEKPILLFH